MNVVLITDSYPPEIRSASHLMQELAEGLRDRGHKVTVVTSYPQYNLPEELKSRVFNAFSVEDGIDIIRVKTLPHHKVNLIIRGISQLTMPYIFSSKMAKYLKDKIDGVIVYSPPLTLATVGKVVKNKYGSRFILNIQDIFPQNAIDLGILKNWFMIKFFERMESKAYERADKITVHSEGNRNFLVNLKHVPENRIHVLHNWIDLTPYLSVHKNGKFRKQYGLDNRFIFLFAGIIGPSQGLDIVIKAANEIKEITDICFLLVGDGMEKERLMKMAKQYSLKNIIFQPFVSKEEYPELVKDVDVGMVCLSSMNKTPIVPSKILGYMAASIPIVAFLNRESDGHRIIKDAQCGHSEVSDEPMKAAEIILKIYKERDKIKQYGENGFKYVSTNFGKKVCIDKLEKLF